MDPYEQTQSSSSIPDEYVDEEEQFKELETELAPKDADYYGILNVPKEVNTHSTHSKSYCIRSDILTCHT